MGITKSVLNGFITLRVPMQLLKELEALSHRERKTTSAVIREAIVEHVSATKTRKD
jgi:predicted DNA-binding protein